MNEDYFAEEDKIFERLSEHLHEHLHEHGHTHNHSHTQTKAVLNRMARLIGHLQATKKMIEDGRDCSEVLIQLSAVDAAIRAVSRVILKDHLKHCIVEAIQDGDEDAIDDINKAIEQFMK